MKQPFQIIPGVFLFLLQDEKVLLARRYQTGYEDGNYNLVGGHVEGGETLREAIAREAKEEIGITIPIANLKYVLTSHRWSDDLKAEQLGFYFAVEEWEGEVINAEPEECDDVQWFPLDDLPQNIIPHMQVALDCYKKGETYMEFNWDR